MGRCGQVASSLQFVVTDRFVVVWVVFTWSVSSHQNVSMFNLSTHIYSIFNYCISYNTYVQFISHSKIKNVSRFDNKPGVACVSVHHGEISRRGERGEGGNQLGGGGGGSARHNKLDMHCFLHLHYLLTSTWWSSATL